MDDAPVTRRPTMSARTLAAIGLILVVAAWLRFARLDSQPMWIDEAMTTLISLGRSPREIPIGVVLPLTALPAYYSFREGSTARTVWDLLGNESVQHSHPPLFYVITHAWLGLRRPAFDEVTWAVRASAAFFGVVSVAAAFALGAAAFSTQTGLLAAAFAAVSPMGVMLSQEARNYTVALAFVTLALAAMAAIIRRASAERPVGAALWLCWIAMAILSLYAHYFSGLSVVAQVMTLLVFFGRTSRRSAMMPAGAAVIVAVAFLPWAHVVPVHLTMPPGNLVHGVSDWIDIGYDVLKVLQGALTGRTFEVSSTTARDANRVVTLVITIWAYAVCVVALRRMWRDRATAATVRALVAVAGIVIVEMWIFTAIGHRYLWSATRYHFAYTPSIAALLGASFVTLPERSSHQDSWRARVLRPRRAYAIGIVLVAGLVCSVLTDYGLKYPKPERLDAMTIAGHPEQARPALMAFGVDAGNVHEAVAATTELREIYRRTPNPDGLSFLLVRRADLAENTDRDIFWRPEKNRLAAVPNVFWERLPLVRGVTPPPATMWVTSTWLERGDYRERFTMTSERGEAIACALDPGELGRGRPPLDDVNVVRLYHCGVVAR